MLLPSLVPTKVVSTPWQFSYFVIFPFLTKLKIPEPIGSKIKVLIDGSYSFKNYEQPLKVPPVPDTAQKASIFLPAYSQISGPVDS